jgi:hypothetical protein
MKHFTVNLIFISGLTVAFTGCGYYDAYMRAKQLRAYIDLQSLCRSIDLRNGHALSQKEAEQIVQTINQGRDSWGTKVIYRSRVKGNKTSYILVSLGSDRKADVADLEEYFESPERSIRDEPWRDLIFRDGQPVTLAGK